MVCAANVRRGDTTCTNHRMIPMLAANESVLGKIEKALLTPEFVERTLAAVMRRIPSRADVHASRATLDARLRKVKAGLRLLVAKYAESGSDIVAAEMTRRETERQQLQQELTQLDQQPQLSSGMVSRIEALAKQKVAEFKRLMHTQTPVARQLLGMVLRGRICFKPQRRGAQAGFRWDAETGDLFGLLEGIIPAGSAGVERATGIEPVSEAWEASVLPLY
jgi:hypothetical protein